MSEKSQTTWQTTGAIDEAIDLVTGKAYSLCDFKVNEGKSVLSLTQKQIDALISILKDKEMTEMTISMRMA